MTAVPASASDVSRTKRSESLLSDEVEGERMSRSAARTPWEFVALALLVLFSLVCLIFVLVGVLIPDKTTGALTVQNGFLALGPLAGSLGAIAMIWLRNRTRPAKAPLALAIALWMIGATLLGFGVFTAFTPGDRSILTNLGYSIALCLTPGGVLSLLGLGTFWYSQLRNRAEGLRSTTVIAAQTTSADSETSPDYDDLRRRAAEYRTRIRDLIREKDRAAYADHLAAINVKLGEWQQQVNRLVSRLSAFDADAVLQRDLRAVPAQIGQLEAQLDGEQDVQVRLQMQETLAGYRTQRAQLDALVSLMRRTRLQLDQTLSAMGTIYSQVQMLQAMDIDGVRARQIVADIDDQVAELNDLLLAMAEVDGSQDDAASGVSPHLPRSATDAENTS
jgi:hypothetical protein